MPVGPEPGLRVRDPDFASTLAHGLALLECFQEDGPLLTNKAMARASGLSKSTVSRLTHTLMTRGLLAFDDESGAYRLGAGVLTLAYPMLAGLQARQIAHPHMQWLARQTGGSVSLGLQHGGGMLYVETVRSHALKDFRPDIGARLPLAPTAMGRAWLAQASAAELQEMLATARPDARGSDRISADRASAAPAADLARSAALAAAQLAAQGYCTSLGEWRAGVHALAVPLPAPVDGTTLVLNCGLLTARLRKRSIDEVAGQPLLQAARRIGAALACEDAAAPEQPVWTAAPGAGPDDETLVVTTLAGGLDVLAAFRPGERRLGNKDFAERSGLSRSTVARLTYTLLRLGYLHRLPGQRQYSPGPALLGLVHPLLASLHVRQVARPFLQQLAQTVDGAVSLTIHERCRMVHIETSRATTRLPTQPDIGSAMPMLQTAAGKAWLCHASPELRRATLNRLRVGFPRDYEAHAAQLAQAQREFAQTGICSNQAQWRKDVYGFATVLPRPVAGHTIVVNCGLPARSGAFAQRRQEILPLLQAMSRELGQGLE